VFACACMCVHALPQVMDGQHDSEFLEPGHF
jgi:hypothetical protein